MPLRESEKMPLSRRGGHIRAGTLVGRYVVLSLVGEGGMGAVYLAFDPELDRRVALKVLHPRHESTSSEFRARLMREAQAMARLAHPNVVNVHDVGLSDRGHVFIAMEFVEGDSVRRWLTREKHGVREVLDVFLQAGAGLAAAHQAGIVHRDFKPDNVLLGSDGRVRVTDFGLARAEEGGVSLEQAPTQTATPVRTGPDRASADDRGDAFGSAGTLLVTPTRSADSSGSALDNPLTMTGALMGTPGYMAPEQYGASSSDVRTDVFAFCASLWQGFYGELPFAGTTMAEVETATKAGAIRETPNGRVPGWLRRVLLRGLAPRKEDRPSSMRELLAMLRDDPARRWRRGAIVAGIAAALLGGAWAVHATDERRARACDTATAPARAAWSPARKAKIVAAFKETGKGYADMAWTHVERVIDDYVNRAAQASEAACIATRVRGEQSPQMLELRSACIEDRLVELGALTEVLAGADAEVVKSAVKAARALSPLEPCSDVDRLTASVRLPDDRSLRAEIRSLQDEIARAKELGEAGRRKRSLELLQALRERVERAGWGPLLLKWNERIASVERWSDEKAAVAELERAIALADRFRADDSRAAAEIALGDLEGSWLGHTEQGHMWMRMADGSIARLGGNAALEVQRDEQEAWVYQHEHKLPQAAPLFRRAIARAREAGIANPETLASAHSGLAAALMAEGRLDEGEEEAQFALTAMVDEYGRTNPRVAGYLNNLAMGQLAAGHVDAALATATEARDLWEANVKRGDSDAKAADYGLAFHTLGEVQMRARRYDDAVKSLSQARATYVAAHGMNNADVAYADYELATAYRGLGRASEAQGALDEAVTIEKVATDVPAAVLAGSMAAQAALDLERGDANGAVDLMTKALALVHEGETETSSWDLADMQLTLAKALRAGGADGARAAKLAGDAREAFRKTHDDALAAEAATVADVAPSRPTR